GDEIEAIAAFLANYLHVRVELLPYHKMGSFKYHALEEKEVFTGKTPDPLVVQQIKEKYHFY
ncbi:MAG: glycyl-radical enzyme activating protein, partial [Cellulosilyticaceae bacterium]